MVARAGMTTLAAALLGILLSGMVARAQIDEEKAMIRAMGEVSGELQQCAVYFLVISACVSPQEPTLGQTYQENANKVGGLSVQLGRSYGVSDEAYAAMAKLLTTRMMTAMGGNCTNIAVLIQKYGDFCRRLSQDADPRFKEWVQCIRSRRSTCDGPALP